MMKLLEIIKTKSFLFPKTMPRDFNFLRYLEWFENKNKMGFSQMPTMVHFETDVLDQFKNKIVWTGFAPTGGRTGEHALHTLVQINKEYHIIFLFASEENKVSMISTLYLLDVDNYIKFLTDNEKYIMKTDINLGFKAGFEGRHGMGVG